MACAVAARLLEPSGDFPAWLEAQGVNAEVARAMDSELGIRDYGVLRACVGDGLVRAELLATARDRLPFGFYAVLRQVVKALQGADTQDGGTTPGWDADAAVSSPGDVTLGGLVDVLLALFSGLSRELMLSARRLGDADDRKRAAASPPYADGAGPENFMATETGELMENDESPVTQSPDAESNSRFALQRIKEESPCAELTVTQTLAVDSGHGDGVQLIKLENLDGGGFTAGPSQPGFQSDNTAAEYTSHSSLQTTDTHGGAFAAGPSQLVFPAENAAAENTAHPSPQSGATRGEAWGCAAQGTSGLFATPAPPPALPRPPYGGDLLAKEKERPYSCKVCRRMFTLKANLHVHLRVHTGEKPYHCDVCGLRFMMKPNLIVHQRRVHTGEKPYHCAECGLKFVQHCTLIRHLRAHAPPEPGGAHRAAAAAAGNDRQRL